MTTVTLFPLNDGTVGSGWSKNGFSGSYSAALSDSSDATYGSVNSSTATPAGELFINLATVPGYVLAITAVSITLRCLTSSTKNSSHITASVGNPGGGLTALSSAVNFTPTTSFSNITQSATLNDATISDWSNAYLHIVAPNDGNGNTLEVSEASVTITVTVTSGPVAKSTVVSPAVQSGRGNRRQPHQPQILRSPNTGIGAQPPVDHLVKHTNVAVESAAHERQQMLPRPQVVPGIGQRLPSQHIITPKGMFVACQTAAQNANYHAQMQHFQALKNNRTPPVARHVKKTEVACQTAAHAENHTDQPQVHVGKTRVYVPPVPPNIRQVSASQAAVLNRRQPAQPQVHKGMTARGAGEIIKRLEWAVIAPFYRRQPRQPMGGRAGTPKPTLPCPYIPMRVPEADDYRPMRVDPVETYVPMRVPEADDYRPARVPDCGG